MFQRSYLPLSLTLNFWNQWFLCWQGNKITEIFKEALIRQDNESARIYTRPDAENLNSKSETTRVMIGYDRIKEENVMIRHIIISRVYMNFILVVKYQFPAEQMASI